MNIVKNCKYGLMAYNILDVYVGKSFLEYGEYSEGEVALFRNLIQENDVVIDVGANIGAHTVPLSRIVGPNGFVISLEAERHNYYTLCANIAINNLKNVFCFNQAVGDAAGSIFVPEIDHDRPANFGAIELKNSEEAAKVGYSVSMCTLDSLNLQLCKFIKIDVEGMELDVIRGSTSLIQRTKPILYVEDDRKEKSDELRKTIVNLGYDLYMHQPRFFNKNNFYMNETNVFIENLVSKNLLCVHKEKSVDVSSIEYLQKL